MMGAPIYPVVGGRIALTGPAGTFKAGDAGKVAAVDEDGGCEVRMDGSDLVLSVKRTGYRLLPPEDSGTLDRVREMVAEYLCLPIDDVKAKSNVIDDLGADSLDMIELTMQAENLFSVSIPQADMQEVETPEALAAVIDRIQRKA